MKETWRYYDYLRRWGLFLFFGLALGALAGFGCDLQQDQQALFKAKATVVVIRADRKISSQFTVVSAEFSDPKRAVDSIVNDAHILGGLTKNGNVVDIREFSIDGRYPSPWWKPIVFGGVIGGLMALGTAFIWDDAGAYLRHRRQITSKDA